MTLQNRVTPFGAIVADPARGTVMGNRGILHGPDRRLGSARWRHKAWIVCALEFRGRRRAVMAPGRYTELFFLDEATALAAGHRPCAECRREAYRRYVDAWTPSSGSAARPKATDLDRALHEARICGRREQATFEADPAGLPDGTMVAHAASAWLLWHGRMCRWRPAAYDAGMPIPSEPVTVLTPRLSVDALRAGFVPQVHASAALTLR